MKTKRLGTVVWLGLAGVLGTLPAPREAQACGGFFCSANQPVNQAAERIVFADNGDGTVTAVIQILYQGAAPKFSWLLPISTVPTGDNIAVASNLAFQRLQTATNPQYNLTTRVEGSCKPLPPSQGFGGATSSPSGSGGLVAGTSGNNGGVVVEASGTVGAFDWSVISVDSSLADPATVAVKWLEDNGYTVGDGTPGLVRPYLTDGLYLLALKLTKGADTGSIRPIVLTYDAARPMIPIKLTAVAANDDMGVMAWLLSSARGVPQNYLSLELNEAKINWFNANSNYNAVVTAAADEAGGQGFVTEFAGANPLAGVLWTPQDESQWQSFQSGSYANFEQAFAASYIWGAWDGFWDAVRDVVALTPPLTLTEFQKCPSCYPGQAQFASGVTSATYVDALKTQVTDPVKDLQTLFDAHAYVTRLYTTMSAAEMNVDPLFTFNSSLPALSNVHSAERVIECKPELYQTEAPWRIQLGEGVVRGTGSQALARTWPTFDSQPANSRIVRLAATGPGLVIEDNGQVISAALDAYAATLPASGGSGGAAVGGSGNSGGAILGSGGVVTAGAGTGGAGGSQSSGGCSLALDGEASPWALPALAALAGLLRRRRAKASRHP